MCCGKGGDLLKWRNNDVKHLICVDLAKISVEQCEQRYNEMKERNANTNYKKLFNAEFIVADCTKVNLNWVDILNKLFLKQNVIDQFKKSTSLGVNFNSSDVGENKRVIQKRQPII